MRMNKRYVLIPIIVFALMGSMSFAGDIYKVGTLFLNATSGVRVPVGNFIVDNYEGVGIQVPLSWLHVQGNATINGTLIVDGINITGRQINDNTTQKDLSNTKLNISLNYTTTGYLNFTGNANVTLAQNISRLCLNAICTRYIYDNGTGVVIQG